MLSSTAKNLYWMGRYLQRAKTYFEQIGIPQCGRVAEFEYINMDVCIERARKIADRLNRAGVAAPLPVGISV